MPQVSTEPPLLVTATLPTSSPRVKTWSTSTNVAVFSLIVMLNVTETLPPVFSA